MERTEALRLLGSTTPDDRLRAARSLERTCVAEDLPALKSALTGENNRWVKSALLKAIVSVQTDSPIPPVFAGVDADEDHIIDQIHADAVEETTKRLVHELRPILGRLDVAASGEISTYKDSRTKIEVTRLREFLLVIDRLSQAASAPVFHEFDLAAAIEETLIMEKGDGVVPIQSAGQKPMVILGASSYLQMILANAVRNSIEATRDLPAKEPVVVTWGANENEYWITVLDRGCGLPAAAQRILEIGTTTKKDHLGMGLALAHQAAVSINGRIELGPRDPCGTKFELLWQKQKQ